MKNFTTIQSDEIWSFCYAKEKNKPQDIKSNPAMAIGLAKRFMSIEDIVNLVPEEVPKKRGSYKKRDKI